MVVVVGATRVVVLRGTHVVVERGTVVVVERPGRAVVVGAAFGSGTVPPLRIPKGSLAPAAG